MDFFDRQELARKNSKILIIYYVLAVIGITCTFGFAALGVRALLILKNSSSHSLQLYGFFAREEFLIFSGSVLVLILLSTFFKGISLSKGGEVVARSLGGREVDPSTGNASERMLINVVEEMSIASGVPVPSIYILDQEDGINAFAAGHSPSNATIGVTSGCLRSFNRDELQGVIAHEFSHILNGDMRLNIRMMSVLFGILMMTILGRGVLRAFANSSGSSSRSRSNSKGSGGGAIIFILLISITLIVIGFLGSVMAKLIKAALSRQREFLADASAVQFTRNPSGIAGALNIIGGSFGSRINHARAEEASHMFFGSCFKKKMSNLFATHPPIEDRIRAIDSNWQGFGPERQSNIHYERLTKFRSQAEMLDDQEAAALSLTGTNVQPSGDQVDFFEAKALDQIGQIHADQLGVAQNIRAQMDENWITAVHQKSGAQAAVFFLLLSQEQNLRSKQLAMVEVASDEKTFTFLKNFTDQIPQLHSSIKIALMDMAIPALRRLSPDEYDRFNDLTGQLIASDGQVVLFEFMIQRIVRRHLDIFFGRTRPVRETDKPFSKLNHESSVLISTIASLGKQEEKAAHIAFNEGAAVLEEKHSGKLQFQEAGQCGLKEIDKALQNFESCGPYMKKWILIACGRAAVSDNQITSSEAELLRAIADSIGSPIPPFVAQRNTA